MMLKLHQQEDIFPTTHSRNNQSVFRTLSVTLRSIWLSGRAPSKPSQRSSTKSGSASTSLRGRVKDPRDWPQLWESWVKTNTMIQKETHFPRLFIHFWQNWTCLLYSHIFSKRLPSPWLWAFHLWGREPGSERPHPIEEMWIARKSWWKLIFKITAWFGLVVSLRRRS